MRPRRRILSPPGNCGGNDVTVARSTGGRAPALAALLREALEAWLPQDVDAWMAVAVEARRQWKAEAVPMDRRRPLLLETQNRLYESKKS